MTKDELKKVRYLIKKTAFCSKEKLPKYPSKKPSKKEINEVYLYNPKTEQIDKI